MTSNDPQYDLEVRERVIVALKKIVAQLEDVDAHVDIKLEDIEYEMQSMRSDTEESAYFQFKPTGVVRMRVMLEAVVSHRVK